MDLSIIVPVYNSEDTVRKCLLSILESDINYKFEIIVVDDGSKDASIDLIKDLDIKIVRQKNKGAAAARNKGAQMARSNIIVFIDSDVILSRDSLKRFYVGLSQKEVHFMSARYSVEPANNGWIHKYKALADYFYYFDSIFTETQKESLIRGAITGGGAEGYKKDVFLKLGGFDENIKGAGVEREKLFSLLPAKNAFADGKIVTKHHFPNFNKLIKDYFFRSIYSTELNKKYNFRQPYLDKNKKKIIIGSLTVLMLLLSVIKSKFIFLGVGFLITHIFIHWGMLETAVKRYGGVFAIYTFIINLFFCLIITTGGAIGILRYSLK